MGTLGQRRMRDILRLFRGKLNMRVGVALLLIAFVPRVTRADDPGLSALLSSEGWARVPQPIRGWTSTNTVNDSAEAKEDVKTGIFSGFVEPGDAPFYGLRTIVPSATVMAMSARSYIEINHQASCSTQDTFLSHASRPKLFGRSRQSDAQLWY